MSAHNRAMSQGSGRSRAGTGASQGGVTAVEAWKRFHPCATTASMFLYAQGSSILCLHHDTLAVERRFQRHTEEVLFIAVDNASERGAGRLVVSYDAGQTTVVWDIFTGDEIARFASYVDLCVASWMRNGNIAFGNVEGSVMLFEPSTSEHISARTICDPITAIAPAADCRTHALGYNNGSILIVTLQPTFTILHTLTTTRPPSPVVTLAWHGSSSKQKSDMLATQMEDGDLRVWSIAKQPSSETPKVVRVLKRSENVEPGNNWLSWSKNGRIVQHSNGETVAWDVRTKHVTFESIPTLASVHGLAIHGPTATLFTLGDNHTVQQFELSPPTLVANKQHPPPVPPPSPPVSIEEQQAQDAIRNAKKDHSIQNAIHLHSASSLHQTSESEEETMSPLQKIKNEMDRIEERRQTRAGNRSPTSASMSSHSSGGSRRITSSRSVSSKVTASDTGTAFSYGSAMRSSTETTPTGTWASSSSVASSARSRGQGSRLKEEVLRSPEDVQRKADLFPCIRTRLDDVPYLNPQRQDRSQWTPADLRRQMLNVVFGWNDDIEALIQDELRQHPLGSTSFMLLSKWVGEVDVDMASENMSSSDWMLLAMLSDFGGRSTKKIGHAYVQRLLGEKDIHAAATILLALGDHNDAVEVYVSHNFHLEAVLLTSLVFPNDWQRQSGLVRKWGEFAVQHGQQHLAIRCFSCTGSETTGVLTSPRAYETVTPGQQFQSLPQIVSPLRSPPGANSARITQKNAPLKLITSFRDTNSLFPGDGNSKFHGLGDDDRTPMGGTGVTPIAESALSPGGTLPFSRARSSRHPDSARTATPGGFGRARLPSIGETPIDTTPRSHSRPPPLVSARDRADSKTSHEDVPPTLSSAKFDPAQEAQSPMTQVPSSVLPSPARNAFTELKQDARTRNGSRDRKPDGLQIQWPPMESILTGDYMSPASETGLSRHSRSLTESDARIPRTTYSRSDFASPPVTGDSVQSLSSLRSPPQTGKSIDRYISSLEEAQFHAKQQRSESRQRQQSRSGQGRRGSDDDRGTRARSQSRSRYAGAASEQDEARDGVRYIKPAKRSPSSPIPMSPEDFPAGSTETRADEVYYSVTSPSEEVGPTSASNHVRNGASRSRVGPSEAQSRTSRPKSRQRGTGSRAGSQLRVRAGSRAYSRQRSPTRLEVRDGRGRSQSRTERPAARSPSSPLPMSPQAQLYRDEDKEELRAVREAKQRFRSRQRSTSQRPQAQVNISTPVNESSADCNPRRQRSVSRQTRQERGGSRRGIRELSSDDGADDLRSPVSDGSRRSGNLVRTTSQRLKRKEMAARELEERRQSLARRPSAPAIPTPNEVLAGRSPISGLIPDYSDSSPSNSRGGLSGRLDSALRSKTRVPDGSHVGMGLPATPRAMRHPRYMSPDGSSEDIPAVPELPRMPIAPAQRSQTDPAELSLVLPSTTYNGSQRPPLRTMSAPIPEEPSAVPPVPTTSLPTRSAFQEDVPSGNRSRATPTAETRQAGSILYTNTVNPMMISIDETMQVGSQAMVHNPANDDLIPPPPPPPPLLPELQHLARPPVPPPAPSPFTRMSHSRTASSSSIRVPSRAQSGSGVISIAIDGMISPSQSRQGTPGVEILPHSPPPPPPPPVLSKSAQGFHSRNSSFAEASPVGMSSYRGRIGNDHSIAGKLSRATHRMRSKSGSRNRNMSPPIDVYRGPSPYESVIIPGSSIELPVRSQTVSPSVERHPKEVKAGLTPEMIRNGFI